MQNILANADGPTSSQLEARIDSRFAPPLQKVELDHERELICYSETPPTGRVFYCQLFPPPRLIPAKYQLSTSGIPADPNAIVLPTERFQMEYIENQRGNIISKPFSYDPFNIGLIPGPIVKLLALPQAEQFNVIVFADKLRMIIYTTNGAQIWAQPFTKNYQKFGEPQSLAGLTASGRKLHSTALANSNLFAVAVPDNKQPTPNNTPLKVFSRNTLWQLESLDYNATIGAISYPIQKNFISLLPGNMRCEFKLRNGTLMPDLLLGKDCNIGGYTTDAPAILEFQLRIDDNATTLYRDFKLQIARRPIQLLPVSQLFPDKSVVEISINFPNMTVSYFSRDRQELIAQQLITVFSNKVLWLDNLSIQIMDNKNYEASIIATEGNRRQLLSEKKTRSTIWQAKPLNISSEVRIPGDPISLFFANYFKSTLGPEKIFCHFNLSNRPFPPELRIDSSLCALQGKIPASGLYQFELIAGDTASTLRNYFNFTVADLLPKPIELTWLWATLASVISCVASVLTLTCAYLLCIKSCCKKQNKENKLIRDERVKLENNNIKNYISFIDNEKEIDEKRAVFTILGNPNSSIPNHVAGFLELFVDGTIVIYKFELLIPNNSAPIVKKQPQLNINNQEQELLLTHEIQSKSNDSGNKPFISLKKFPDDFKTWSSDEKNIKEKELEKYIWKMVIGGTREECYHSSWQISMRDANKLLDTVKQEKQKYEQGTMTYSIYGEKSYLTRYAPCFFGPSGPNCYDFLSNLANKFIKNAMPPIWQDYLVSRSMNHFNKTKWDKDLCCKC